MALVQPTPDNVPGYLREVYKYLAILGAGSQLSDPGADRILFWDDSAGQVTWLTAGTGLSISGTTIALSDTLAYGTYSPTVTAVTNVDSSTLLGTASYIRVGSVVSVYFGVRINATTAGAAIEVGVSLPVASALGAVTLWGSVAATDVAARGLGVVRDTTNDRAAVVGIVAVDTQVDYAGSFGYLID